MNGFKLWCATTVSAPTGGRMILPCVTCGSWLTFSARRTGLLRCGPCARNILGTPAIADRVNHDPGDEDRP